MYDDFNKIWATLWQGSAPPYGTDLKALGFDVVVLTAKDNSDPSVYPADVEFVVAPGDDDTRPHRVAGFAPGWIKAGKQVAEQVRGGKNVLVTCMAGLNRSGFVIVVALHTLTGWPVQDCIDLLQSKRMMSLNNTAFADYLLKNL